MNRRADRTIAVATLAAVAIVPTVLLVALKIASPSPVDAGATPQTSAAGVDNRVKLLAGQSPTALTPSPLSTRPGSTASGKPSAGVLPVRPTAGEPKLTSYQRITEAWLSGAAGGDSQHLTENTTFTLNPAFAMDARGTRVNTVAGTPTTTTQRVVVKGNTLSTYDGDEVKHTELSDAQIEVLSKQGDSRQLAYLIRLVPGSKKETDRFGSSRYEASVLLKDVIDLLPKAQADEITKLLPLTSTISANMWADKADRPSWAQLTAAAPEVDLKVVMTFKSYR